MKLLPRPIVSFAKRCWDFWRENSDLSTKSILSMVSLLKEKGYGIVTWTMSLLWRIRYDIRTVWISNRQAKQSPWGNFRVLGWPKQDENCATKSRIDKGYNICLGVFFKYLYRWTMRNKSWTVHGKKTRPASVRLSLHVWHRKTLQLWWLLDRAMLIRNAGRFAPGLADRHH